MALRAHDWTLQSNQAAKQIMQIDAQILAAEIRVEMADKELKQSCQADGAGRGGREFLRDKYTNEELYGWMSGQISGLYFQTYQLAFDIAKRAERAFRNELGVEDSVTSSFGHWDGLKKGLLAGEKLALDIKRLETAYHEQNRREYELTKHVSLLQLDPLALVQLRETGTCTVSLPEELFAMDGPGHYFRRIRHLAVTIPCVTGPYVGVNCKLTLLHSSLRKSPKASDGNDYPREDDDNRFIDYFGSIESIVVSSGDNDSGLFEPNLRDERYLPFENAGVISEWRLELPGQPQCGHRAVPVRLRDHQRRHPKGGGAVTFKEDHYPFWSRAWLGKVEALQVLAAAEGTDAGIDVYEADGDEPACTLRKGTFGPLLHTDLPTRLLPEPCEDLQLLIDSGHTNAITDLWIALQWRASS